MDQKQHSARVSSMATQTRQSANSVRTNSASRHSTQPANTDQTRAPSKTTTSSRPVTLKLKVAVRRLPPGLTEDEFQRLLGVEWRPGSEKVDWYSFKAGKITKDISKPSIPGRAYINLTKPEYLAQLSSAVREISFLDAKNTAGDSCLLGPPLVEMSTYGRIPTSKPRKDARQGTIDQDSEFMGFLQGLTNPIAKPTPVDVSSADREMLKPNADSVTPLIQFLRDKKANKEKAKEQTSVKNVKQSRVETKDAKVPVAEKPGGGAKGKGSKEAAPAGNSDKKIVLANKPEKMTRETIKVLSKPTVRDQKSQQGQAASGPKSQVSSQENNVTQPVVERKQRKVGAEAKLLLHRDLGIGSGSGGGRRRRGEAASTNQAVGATSNTATVTTVATTATSSSSTAMTTATSRPRRHSAVNQGTSQSVVSHVETPASVGATSTKSVMTPSASKDQLQQGGSLGVPTKDSTNTSKSGSANATQAHPPVTDSSSFGGSTRQAFLKHANASQGITEALLQAAMSAFGNVRRIEIDKKKGFAYVDYSEPDSLRKAIAASPVKVAQGSVVVLERKEKFVKQDRLGKGGSGQSQPQPISGPGNVSDKATAAAAGVITTTSSSNAPSTQTTVSNSTSAGSKSNSHRNHRPRGNRGRGSGRNGAEKSGGNQQTSQQTSQTALQQVSQQTSQQSSKSGTQPESPATR